jgi:probable phosphomutase (TIGR03848 family)
VPNVFLVRHGRTAANASGVLAGWTPGVVLDEKGREQAVNTGGRLLPVPLVAIVTSPLERTRETTDALNAARETPVAVHVDERVGECKYGDWTNQPLKTLSKDPLWKVVQGHPSAAVFPGGEGLAEMSQRAVGAVRDWNARLSAEHGDDVSYAVVSHGDVIKAIVADALGMHLDTFQRISIDPCSVTVIRYTELRPFVLKTNDTGSDLSGFAPAPKKGRVSRKKVSSDAAIGGGAGSTGRG